MKVITQPTAPIEFDPPITAIKWNRKLAGKRSL